MNVKAVMVCVDYADVLAITLPRSAPHFSSITVATTPEDEETRAVASRFPNVRCHLTRVFYARNALFNKGGALEETFDVMGRDGWFTVLDADIVLPSRFAWPALEVGCLYTPLRRMVDPVPPEIPPDEEWDQYPLHRQQKEFAGYFQLAHASDPVLRGRPWYPSWMTAGGCDSEFQARWHPGRKRRPAFEVLHLGPSGENWAGRASERVDGTVPPDAEEKRQRLRNLIRRRVPGPDRFRHEKLP